ncbi:YqaA family protein [Aestuariispira ectoiniformans]|uniref:YqaA family protein n=1 Tax=Aestuariispira ectoiniformans TaxID=2775080 RepID=UPI00223B659B|nr:YqaA family protein [Aestuariispira ectoiniformans]
MSSLGYLGLFLTAFFAATLLPIQSEAVLAALTVQKGFSLWWLVLVAGVGNTLGSVVNWCLGRWCLHFQDRRWFPVPKAALAKAQDRFQRWGVWSLLLAWTPFIGDPLTFAAGVLRVRFDLFLLLVAISKFSRYIVVAYIAVYAAT